MTFTEGTTPKLTDTAWKTRQKILMALRDGGTGGGGTGEGNLLLYDNTAALPAAPTLPAQVWIANFRDDSDSVMWDPVALAWI